jgi:nucleotide-binding universal stress UspA family protein
VLRQRSVACELPAALRATLRDVATAADLERGIRKWLDAAFARLTADAGVEVDRRIRRGITEEEILKEVRRCKPDIIVMGSNGIAHASDDDSGARGEAGRPHARRNLTSSQRDRLPVIARAPHAPVRPAAVANFL